MKIRMRPGFALAGPDVRHLGRGVFEAPDAQALAVVAAGHADAVGPPPAAPEPEPEPETADAPDAGAETASLKSRGKRG